MKKTVLLAAVLALALCMAFPAGALEQGDAGDRVKQLQETLLLLGYDAGTPDGQYGPLTEQAVSAFRLDHGMPPGGGADEETLAVLEILAEIKEGSLLGAEREKPFSKPSYFTVMKACLLGQIGKEDYRAWIRMHMITAFINPALLKACLPLPESPLPEGAFLRVDLDNLPSGITREDVVTDRDTGAYYVPREKIEPETDGGIEPVTVWEEPKAPVKEPETTAPAIEPEPSVPAVQPVQPVPPETTAPFEEPEKEPEPEQPEQPSHTHSYVSAVTKEPTCTAEGVRTYTCTAGDSSYTESIPATGHTVVTDPAVPATCTATGLTEGSHCQTCGAVITPQQVIPMAAHTIVADPAVLASCTSTGLTEGSHCQVCGTVITARQEVPATAHVYEEVAHYYIDHYLPPQYRCLSCGRYYASLDELDAHYSAYGCPLGYTVDDSILDWTEDCGETYVPGSYGVYTGDRCIYCGSWR